MTSKRIAESDLYLLKSDTKVLKMSKFRLAKHNKRGLLHKSDSTHAAALFLHNGSGKVQILLARAVLLNDVVEILVASAAEVDED